MKNKLQIIPIDLLDDYLQQAPKNLREAFETLEDADISTDIFSFYVSVSSVYSSKIEGEEVELDSYVKHKKFGIAFLPDYTKKIDDLYNASIFAKNNALNLENVSKAHALLSKHIVNPAWQGKFRHQHMYVITPNGKIEYVATPPDKVETEIKKLFNDIEILLKSELSIAEVFYFAAFIHLIFVKIHPWNDGNGRSARLLEKWFLAQKLGHKAWFIQSEKMYYDKHEAYYENIRLLGLEYSELDFKKSLPFLLMLPTSI